MYERDIWPKLKAELVTPEVIVLTGPRQVGKSTTLKWLLEQVDSENKLYIDLENLSNRQIFSTPNYTSILDALAGLGIDKTQKIYLAIDEIQLVNNLPSVVKYLLDNFQVKFILSGSSSYYLKNQFQESMAGRKLIFEMFPLSFKEFLSFKNTAIPSKLGFDELSNNNAAWYDTFNLLYSEYLTFGGMPKVVLEDKQQRKRELLQDIYNSYILLDVQSLADFRSINEFQLLVNLLASRIGNKLDVSKLSQLTGITRPTVYSYLKFLEQTYLIRLIEPYSQSASIRTKLAKKLYFVDSGIASIMDQLSSGALFENAICHQLQFYGKLNYYSDRSGEIDFILNDQYAFEVKTAPDGSDLKQLTRRSENLGIKESYLVGRDYNPNFSKYIYGAML